MKKILEKIVSIALAVVGLLLIALLLVVMFGAVKVDELDNQLVKVLIISLSAIFTVLGVIMISASFADRDRLNSILLFKDKESATKAAVTVVKNLVKKASKRVETAKLSKVVLLGDENNNVKLVVYVKIKNNDTESVINRLRAEITATCDKVLEYQFSSIDFRVTKVKADYKPADADIDAKVAQYQQEKEAAQAKLAAQRAKNADAADEQVADTDESPSQEVVAAEDTTDDATAAADAADTAEVSKVEDIADVADNADTADAADIDIADAADIQAAEDTAEDTDIAIAAPTTEVIEDNKE